MRLVVIMFLTAIVTAIGIEAMSQTAPLFEYRQRAILCAPHAELHYQFTQKPYRESIRWWGITAEGGAAVGYASPKGNWTILRTRDDGMACVVASGTEWHQSPAQPKEDEHEGEAF